MGVETVLIARTDVVAATLIQSNVDGRDHQFILEATNPELRRRSLSVVLAVAMSAGKTGAELQSIEDDWIAGAGLMTFSEAVITAINLRNDVSRQEKRRRIGEWSAAAKYSNERGREIAKKLGAGDVFWDWDIPRTREGFYRFRGLVEAAVVRGRAFAPHTDLIWMETVSPDFAECSKFAQALKAEQPETMLAYNLSSSFNWDATGMSDYEMREFIPRIAKLGFC
ncbi:Isocitrate lyase [Platanthera guangdongensis]|uniref:Isocitrate lyase n=1 Tax=Platanthera guangdongensis TaxID=2320717 RepID=A0ABR2LNA8_9ASPA